ncbi:sensor histidine kinase [Streptosporangium sp. NPDC000396]|uniref:sensor histidine kinase n=1 Tax=Streptosporangium sp. NPDC000396 TaxID=3366185 RepID=UPI00368DCC23
MSWINRLIGWGQRHQSLLDAVLAVLVGLPLLLWSGFVLSAVSPALAGALLAHVAMGLRRRAPLWSFAAVSAGCAAMLTAGGMLLPPSLVIFPWSLYSVCAHGRRGASAWGLAVAVLGSAAIGVKFWLNPQEAAGLLPSFVALFLLAVCLVAWSLGVWRRTQRAYLASVEDRARRAEAEREERARRAVSDERARIAREIHDVVSHSLSVVISQAQGGTYAVRSDPARAHDILTTIAEAGRHALTDMRSLLGVLRAETPLEPDSYGAQPTLGELPRLIDGTRAAGLEVTWQQEGVERRLSPAAELAVYRMVQESLTNTLKHAGAGRRAHVRLSWGEDELAVDVRDDGSGRDAAGAGGGHGLVGMRERFLAFGGTATAGPATGGFLVSARLPYSPDRRKETRA